MEIFTIDEVIIALEFFRSIYNNKSRVLIDSKKEKTQLI